MQKRFDENVASMVEAVKERELRAQLEKSSRRKMQDARGEARDELNAAVVQTLSESQADLGISGETTAPPSPDRLQPGAKIRVSGFTQPVVLRRIEGSSAEIEAGPLRMKVAVEQITGIESRQPVQIRTALMPTTKCHGHVATQRSRHHRRNQRHWFHRRRSHRPRRQVSRPSGLGKSPTCAHNPRPRHRRVAQRPRSVSFLPSTGGQGFFRNRRSRRQSDHRGRIDVRRELSMPKLENRNAKLEQPCRTVAAACTQTSSIFFRDCWTIQREKLRKKV